MQIHRSARNSYNSRALSIAITTWVAKLSNSAICLSESLPTTRRNGEEDENLAILYKRHVYERAHATDFNKLAGAGAIPLR